MYVTGDVYTAIQIELGYSRSHIKRLAEAGAISLNTMKIQGNCSYILANDLEYIRVGKQFISLWITYMVCKYEDSGL